VPSNASLEDIEKMLLREAEQAEAAAEAEAEKPEAEEDKGEEGGEGETEQQVTTASAEETHVAKQRTRSTASSRSGSTAVTRQRPTASTGGSMLVEMTQKRRDGSQSRSRFMSGSEVAMVTEMAATAFGTEQQSTMVVNPLCAQLDASAAASRVATSDALYESLPIRLMDPARSTSGLGGEEDGQAHVPHRDRVKLRRVGNNNNNKMSKTASSLWRRVDVSALKRSDSDTAFSWLITQLPATLASRFARVLNSAHDPEAEVTGAGAGERDAEAGARDDERDDE